MKKVKSKAFTLIELLIVCALLSIVSLAIFATINNGIKIWAKLNTQIAEEDIGILFDKFSFDLRNSFKFANLNFSGGKERLELSTLLTHPHLMARTVGKVIYSYDAAGGSLQREELDYSQIFTNKEGRAQVLLKNIDFLRFQYYLYDKKEEQFIWQDQYSDEELPLAVRIEFELKNEGQVKRFAKTASIPVASTGKKR